MTSKTLLAVALAASSALSFGSQALAQAAAPAAPPTTHGAPIPGVCLFSVDGAIAASTVGKYIDTRLQQIVTQVQAELTAEQTSIANDSSLRERSEKSIGQRTVLISVMEGSSRVIHSSRSPSAKWETRADRRQAGLVDRTPLIRLPTVRPHGSFSPHPRARR